MRWGGMYSAHVVLAFLDGFSLSLQGEELQPLKIFCNVSRYDGPYSWFGAAANAVGDLRGDRIGVSSTTQPQAM